MTTKSQFKEFVRQHPSLLNYVNNGSMSWQQFYEMYDLYGADDKVWHDYLSSVSNNFDLLGFLKNIDLNSVQESINSIQRVLGLLQDMNSSSAPEMKKPRPIYKHFED